MVADRDRSIGAGAGHAGSGEPIHLDSRHWLLRDVGSRLRLLVHSPIGDHDDREAPRATLPRFVARRYSGKLTAPARDVAGQIPRRRCTPLAGAVENAAVFVSRYFGHARMGSTAPAMNTRSRAGPHRIRFQFRCAPGSSARDTDNLRPPRFLDGDAPAFRGAIAQISAWAEGSGPCAPRKSKMLVRRCVLRSLLGEVATTCLTKNHALTGKSCYLPSFARSLGSCGIRISYLRQKTENITKKRPPVVDESVGKSRKRTQNAHILSRQILSRGSHWLKTASLRTSSFIGGGINGCGQLPRF